MSRIISSSCHRQTMLCSELMPELKGDICPRNQAYNHRAPRCHESRAVWLVGHRGIFHHLQTRALSTADNNPLSPLTIAASLSISRIYICYRVSSFSSNLGTCNSRKRPLQISFESFPYRVSFDFCAGASTMATVAVGTPLAEALSNAIQPRLVEMGWSSDSSDSALTEYVILMLVNGKTQEQIASELSNDLLGLGEGDTQALDFSRWLFEQVETLNQQINGQAAPISNEPQAIPSFDDQETSTPQPQGFENGPQSIDMNMDTGFSGDGMYVCSR